MKRIALSLLAVLALGAPAKAIVGGPWDNNLFYSPTLSGTFQGTMTSKNLSAVMIFSTSESSPLTSEVSTTRPTFSNMGNMVSFYRGSTAISGVQAVIDGNSRKIAATITPSSSTSLFYIQGFMAATFDNIYPSITYKGKSEMIAIWDAVGSAPQTSEEFKARVRGIKTASTPSAGYWIW